MLVETGAARRVAIKIHGIGYGPAVQWIERELGSMPGVDRATVHPGNGMAHVSCSGPASDNALLGTLLRLGFRADLAGSF
jgi:hypothetical protein